MAMIDMEITSPPIMWSLSAMAPMVPNTSGVNMSQRPSAELATRVHGTVTPQVAAASWAVNGASKPGRRSGRAAGSGPPAKKVCRNGRPAWTLRAMYWAMAATSSRASGIMISMARAAIRHSVQYVPMITGWMRMNRMLIPPSGTTRMKKNVTIHGMVRQRVAAPMAPISASSR